MNDILSKYESVSPDAVTTWFPAAPVDQFVPDAGACIKYKDIQVAIFYLSRVDKWYACQNLCPHKLEMVLARGLVGDEQGIPKLACPMHKKTFSLETGKSISGDVDDIAVYPTKIEDGYVYIGFAD